VKAVEVAIVGGGPAGIATALFLAHAAPELRERIVVLEKERYPREKYCAGALGGRADTLLGTIGAVVDVPSVPIRGVALGAMGRTLSVVHDTSEIGRVVRRVEFDSELARQALARGIGVRDGVRVGALRRTSRGVELDTSAGPVEARVLVGADGVGSVVRRALGFGPGTWRAQALEVDTEPVETDLARDLLFFDVNDRALSGYYWDFPTLVDGRSLVCRGVYLLRDARGSSREIKSILAAALRARGLDPERYRHKRFSERGFERHEPYARPHVLLAGEAAGIDPVTGEGIAQAIQYGAVAGRYVARKIRERDLAFGDWRAEIRGSMLGRDLWVRTLALPLFYGARRPVIERFLLDAPAFVRVGLDHFAGMPWSKRDLLRAARKAFAHTARALAGDGRDPLPVQNHSSRG
jgi:flavin-dependent dehydrogenase